MLEAYPAPVSVVNLNNTYRNGVKNAKKSLEMLTLAAIRGTPLCFGFEEAKVIDPVPAYEQLLKTAHEVAAFTDKGVENYTPDNFVWLNTSLSRGEEVKLTLLKRVAELSGNDHQLRFMASHNNGKTVAMVDIQALRNYLGSYHYNTIHIYQMLDLTHAPGAQMRLEGLSYILKPEDAQKELAERWAREKRNRQNDRSLAEKPNLVELAKKVAPRVRERLKKRS